tara:strand:- start:184 stop:693 length:510 start_codon:yes stop_codon:yes gene_type:complete
MNNNIDYEILELSNNNTSVTSSEIYDEFLTPDSSCCSKSSEDNDFNQEHFSQDIMMDFVSMEDRILALSLSYDTNYKISDLSKIAEYYSIPLTKLNNIENAITNANATVNAKSKKKNVKKKKDELIKDIVQFEEDELNTNVVNRRKELWFYIDELKSDKYLQKHIIFNI